MVQEAKVHKKLCLIFMQVYILQNTCNCDKLEIDAGLGK
jgi:low affinity Fe/Cu permease